VFLVATSLVVGPGLANSSNPKTLGNGTALLTEGLIVRDDHPGVATLATTSLDRFVVVTYLPSADSAEGREALTRVGVRYEQIAAQRQALGLDPAPSAATGLNFSTDSAEQAVAAEPYFQDQPYVGVALAEVRESSRQLRLIQVTYLGGLSAMPEAARQTPMPLARDSRQVLEAWYSRLDAQLGAWVGQAEFDSWVSELRHYQVVSSDPRAEDLIERGRELLRALLSDPDFEFEVCPKIHGPGSNDPNKPKCDECCEAAGSGCDEGCGDDAALVAIAGCAIGAAACAPGLVVAAGCCAATGTLMSKAYFELCHLSCVRKVKKCIYAC
jgi:hypothetical protein